MPRFAIALVLCALTLFATTASAGPGRAPFMLVLEGSRTASQATEKLAFGFRDEGAFTRTGPDVRDGTRGRSRATPDGRLADRAPPVRMSRRRDHHRAHLADSAEDPSWGYEEGAWLIVAGTGAYAGLRGKGTYVRAFLDDASGSIAELWRGLVDFDDVPPQITVAGISVVAAAPAAWRIRRSPGVQRLAMPRAGRCHSSSPRGVAPCSRRSTASQSEKRRPWCSMFARGRGSEQSGSRSQRPIRSATSGRSSACGRSLGLRRRSRTRDERIELWGFP